MKEGIGLIHEAAERFKAAGFPDVCDDVHRTAHQLERKLNERAGRQGEAVPARHGTVQCAGRAA